MAAVATPGDVTRGLIVNAILNQQPGHTVDPNGSIVAVTPERKNFRIDAAVRWETDRWIFVDAHILAKGES